MGLLILAWSSVEINCIAFSYACLSYWPRKIYVCLYRFSLGLGLETTDYPLQCKVHLFCCWSDTESTVCSGIRAETNFWRLIERIGFVWGMPLGKVLAMPCRENNISCPSGLDDSHSKEKRLCSPRCHSHSRIARMQYQTRSCYLFCIWIRWHLAPHEISTYLIPHTVKSLTSFTTLYRFGSINYQTPTCVIVATCLEDQTRPLLVWKHNHPRNELKHYHTTIWRPQNC